MADEVSSLVIAVDSSSAKKAASDLDGLVNAGKGAEGQAKKIGSEYDRTNGPLNKVGKSGREVSKSFDSIDKSAKGAARQTSNLTSSLRSLAAPLAAYLGTREIAQSAEQWTQLNNRLRLVTDSTLELVDAQQSVFAIAQNARQPLSETAELYQRIATNADALELSSGGVAEVVDKISKTLAISGTSGQAASAALTQLGQAFASGTLRGEELNSVLEQAPALAKSIAEGLGVTTGELRKLGQEGELTAQNVISALVNQSDAIDEQFGKIQATGGQAFTVLGNSITKVIGELNDATGASNGLADSVIALSNYLDSGQLTDGLIESFSIWISVLSSASSNLDNLIDDLDRFAGEGTDSVGFVLDAFKQLPANVKAYIELLVTEYVSAFDRLTAYAASFRDGIKAVFTDDTIANVSERLAQDIEGVNALRRDSISAILDERNATIEAAAAERKRREEERVASQERRQQSQQEFQNNAGGFGGGVSSVGGNEPKLLGIDKIRDQLADEDQAIESSFVTRQNALAEYLKTAEIMQGEYNSLTLANVSKYNEDIAALNNQRREEELGGLEKSFAAVQQSTLSEAELETARYANQLETLNAAKSAGLDSIKSYQVLEQELAIAHQNKISAIEAKGLTDRQRFEAKSFKDKSKMMFGLLAQQTAAAAQHDKTAFEANKVAAIANATISTYEGAAAALEWGWPLGPIFAAAITAAGIANIGAISSQSFGGGGGIAPSFAATGATSTTAVTNQNSNQALLSQQPQGQQGPSVVLNINGPVTGLTEDILAEKIIELYDRDYIQGVAS